MLVRSTSSSRTVVPVLGGLCVDDAVMRDGHRRPYRMLRIGMNRCGMLLLLWLCEAICKYLRSFAMEMRKQNHTVCFCGYKSDQLKYEIALGALDRDFVVQVRLA